MSTTNRLNDLLNNANDPAGDDLAEQLLEGLRDGEWLHKQQFAPLAFHIPEILPEGQVLFVGPPKVGKSWWLLGTGLAVASGGKALGCLGVQQRPVLYLALEDGDRRLQSRCRILLGPNEPIPAAFEYLTRIQPGRVVDTIRAWMARHPGAAPLVMLDTLGKVMPPSQPGESAYQRDYRVGSALKAIADDHPGSAVLVNHHDRKAGADDFVDAVSGTHGLAGAADTIIVLSRARHETAGTMKITGRDVEENEYALEIHSVGAWTLSGGSLAAASEAATRTRATANLSDRSSDIYAYVSAHPDVGPTQVGQKFGISAGDAGNYLKRMTESGRLVRKGRGKYSVSTLSTPSTQGSSGDSKVLRFPSSRDRVETVESVETPDCPVCGNPLTDPVAEPGDVHAECLGGVS